ncbi:MAG: hypothetical protein ACE5JX_02460 [Acidobacteriota bacterium]
MIKEDTAPVLAGKGSASLLTGGAQKPDGTKDEGKSKGEGEGLNTGRSAPGRLNYRNVLCKDVMN